MKVTQAITDTLVISVSKLGFTPTEKKVLPVTQIYDFILRKGNLELKEIVVKPPHIHRKGDTLTYNVEAFKSTADRSIGDVIKKLPGVEMDQYGQILYQGKAINRYYIEGMNLLGGRYGLANDNLPHGKVATVEILENHQPIRLLDSLSFSDRAAINIKLKNKVTRTGVVHYGIGGKALIWDINATPMVFMPNWQFLGSLQSNTTGKNTFSTFKDFFQSEYAKNQNWLEIPKVSTPSFSEKRYLDNVSHAGSVNTLKRRKSDFELKLNASVILDKFRQTGNEKVTYFLNDEAFGYTESTNNLFRTNQASLTLNLEKNTRKVFLKNSLKIEQEWRADQGVNIRIERTYNQNNKTGNFKISNNLHKIFRAKNNQYNFYSNTIWVNSKQRLSVNLDGADSTASPLQNLSHTGFSTHNYIDLSRKIARWFHLSTRMGADINLSGFMTELNGYGLRTDTTNNFKWNNYKTYIAGVLNVKTPKWQTILNLPLGYSIIDYKPDESRQNFKKLVLEPSLNLRYRSSQSTEFYAYGMYTNSLSKPGDLYSGFVMTNYLNLTRKATDFIDNHNYSSRVGITHNNVVLGFSLNAGYSINYNVQNQLAENDINTDGSNEINYTLKNNASKFHSGNLNIRQYIFPLKTSFSIGINLSKNESELFINRSFQRYVIQTVSPQAKISFNGLKWLELNYGTNLLRLNNINTAQRITNYIQSLSTAFSAAKNTIVSFSFEHSVIKNTQMSRNYFFGDVLIRYTLPKIKQDFEISLSNIFNRGSFETIHLNNFYTQQTNFQLRPRQILFRGRITF